MKEWFRRLLESIIMWAITDPDELEEATEPNPEIYIPSIWDAANLDNPYNQVVPTPTTEAPVLVKLPDGTLVNPSHVTCIEFTEIKSPPGHAGITYVWVVKNAGYHTGAISFSGNRLEELFEIISGTTVDTSTFDKILVDVTLALKDIIEAANSDHPYQLDDLSTDTILEPLAKAERYLLNKGFDI
jgi:hypothetical protein